MRWLTKKKKTAQHWFANNVMEQAKTRENVCSRLQGPLRNVFFYHLLSTEFPRKKKKKLLELFTFFHKTQVFCWSDQSQAARSAMFISLKSRNIPSFML